MPQTKEQKATYMRDYWARNKERLSANHKVWKSNNRERIKKYSREWTARQSPEWHEERLAYQKSWFSQMGEESREKKREHCRTHSRKRRSRMDELKRNLGCQNCSETEPCALDWHHRDPTTKSGTLARLYKCSPRVVAEEIVKCNLLCANCHRKLTHLKGIVV